MKSFFINCIFIAYSTTILQAQNISLTQADSPTIFNYENDSLIGTIFYADTFAYVFSQLDGQIYMWRKDFKYFFRKNDQGHPINIGEAIRFNNTAKLTYQ